MPTLSHEDARAFYDWFGARQDSQRFFEDRALDDLIAHADFGGARSVFEFGCGTGRLAERLLTDHLPAECRYRAVDISSTMVVLARERLARWGERARVEQTSGAMTVPEPARSVDRFVASYVLDLLGHEDIRDLLAEAGRVLEPGGLLCTVALTRGTSPASRIGGLVWRALFELNPTLVGGCRAIMVRDFLCGEWSVRYSNVITRWSISSEVLVAARTTHDDGSG